VTDHRTIREEPAAYAAYLAAITQNPLADEVYRAVQWVLTRYPATGMQLTPSPTSWRLLVHGPWPGVPLRMAVVYTFDAQYVNVHNLWIQP
jgi:hypothetical protein